MAAAKLGAALKMWITTGAVLIRRLAVDASMLVLMVIEGVFWASSGSEGAVLSATDSVAFWNFLQQGFAFAVGSEPSRLLYGHTFLACQAMHADQSTLR